MTTSAADPPDLLRLALAAAHAAGALLLERFGGPSSGVSSKSTRTDLVSDADRDAETHILGLIRAERPDDRIVAEEGGTGAPMSAGQVTWHVDPLDGTVNYLWGLPHWCVSVHAGDHAGDLVGVVHDPCRNETFTAIPGRAELNGHPLRLTPSSDLGDALVATGFAYDAVVRAEQAAALAPLVGRIRDVRRAGSAALDLAWVAAGRLDAYFERGLNTWDWAAGGMLVRDAGGTVDQLAADHRATGIVAARPGLGERLRVLVS